jgi:hypothetical protein
LKGGVEFAAHRRVMLRNWRGVTAMVVVVLSCSTLGCAHRSGSSSARPIVAGSFGPAAASSSQTGHPAREAVDEVPGRFNGSDRARPSPAVPASTRLNAAPQRPVGTAGALPPPAYNVVVLTQPSPLPDTATSDSRSAAANNPTGFQRSGGPLRPPAATLIAAALIAAIVWLPRVRDRRSSTPPHAT